VAGAAAGRRARFRGHAGVLAADAAQPDPQPVARPRLLTMSGATPAAASPGCWTPPASASSLPVIGISCCSRSWC
jgi:hypothetical protein